MKDTSPFSYGLDCTTEAVRFFQQLIRCSKEYHYLEPKSQKFIDAQLFGSAKINNSTPMSALKSRILSVSAMTSAMDAEYAGLLPTDNETFFGTFAFKNGESPLAAPLQNTQTTISRVAAELKVQSLSGLISPDIDLMCPGNGTTPYFAYHVHALIQSDARKIRLKSVAEEMAESIGWESSLPKAVRLTGKRPGCIYGHARRMASYQTKFVAAGKRRRGQGNDVHWVLDRSRLSPKLALYLLHAWSQVPLLGTPVAVGDFGESLYASWQSGLRSAYKYSRADPYRYDAKAAEIEWDLILQTIK